MRGGRESLCVEGEEQCKITVPVLSGGAAQEELKDSDS
jgi:hypothetical protein